MSSKSRNVPESHSESTSGVLLASDDRSTAWAWLAGLIVTVFIAMPLSAAIAFASNPHTQQLFAGRLSETTQGGYQAFWWIVAILLASLPFLVGFGIAKLSSKALGVVAAIVVLLVIAVVVLGQLFVF